MQPKRKALSIAAALLAAGIAFASPAANAGAVLKNPADTVAIGINDSGALNTSDGSITTNGGGYTGIAFKFGDGSWRDATAPGCLCEGWGVSVNGTVSGFANMDDSPASTNLTFGALTGVTATTATSTASLTSLPGLTVTHTVQPATAAPNALFRVHVKITNATGATVTNLKYVRVMDWDVPPTEFSELVTIVGVGTTTLLERSHDDGFATANPLVDSTGATGTNNTDFIRNGPADHGAYFRFNFGSLADGASYEFDIYYGAAASQAAAVSAITSEAIELYTLGQSNGPADGTPATYIFGFKGVGGVPVGPPVPAGPVEIPTQSEWMLALMALLLAATAGFALKRR